VWRYAGHQLPRRKMNLPEYLVLFSNEGTIDVQVKFEDHEGSVATRKMSPQEISVLISNDGTKFHTRMTFDDWPFAIRKYEIDPAKNKLTIVVRKIL